VTLLIIEGYNHQLKTSISFES
ncbi:MAG: hypothetical protein RLY13_579, partial [Actinomycetota bacterium]